MKQLEHKPKSLVSGGASAPPSLSELRAIRLAQRATNQRVEELKVRLYRLAEHNMEQTVSLIRRWLNDRSK